MKIVRGLVFCGFLPYFIISLFVNPLFDDFLYAADALEYGLLQAQFEKYQNWSGRYFSNVILMIDPITWGKFQIYKIFPIILIILTVLSFYFLLETIIRHHFNFKQKFLFASLLTLLFLHGMPDTIGGLYWYSGAFSYHFANILTVLFLAVSIRLSAQTFESKVLLITFQLILTAAIIGSSETSMIFLVFIIGIISFTKTRLKSNDSRIWFFILIFAIFCSLVVILAPGNEIRGATHSNRNRLYYSIAMGLIDEARFIRDWVTNPVFILLTILSIPTLDDLSEKVLLFKKHFQINPFVFGVSLLALILCGFFLPYFATGVLGQYRSVNVSYFFFLIGWFLFLINFIGFYKKKNIILDLKFPNSVYLLGIPLLMISFYTTGNTKLILNDLFTGSAFKYDKEMKIRFYDFASCSKEIQTECRINEISNYPKSITHPNYFNPLSLSFEQRFWTLKEKSKQANK